ncbi:MAG TPA: tetratricopeptide repeat protein [Pyrinomonadaceae bacterium]|nr:tetratricopeptide repeat protein [Pyrinomonadaceae bacterium]
MIRKGELARAETELDAVLRQHPLEANALNLLGVIRAQQRRVDLAEQLFLRALDAAPTLLGAYLNLGQLYLSSQKSDRALWAFTEASKLAPEQAIINYNLAALYEKRCEYERGLEYLERIPRSLWGPDHLYVLIKCYLGLGRTVEAQAIAAQLKQYDFSWTALNMNLLYDALQVLERLHRMQPDEPGYIYALAIARLHNGEAARARELLNRYIELRPEDARGYYVLGATLYSIKQFPEARAALERSLRLAHYADAEYYLGMIAQSEGDLAVAAQWLGRVLKSEPNHSSARAALGIIHLKQKNYEAARAELERAIALDPKDVTAHYQLGIVYARLGNKERSQSLFALTEKLRSEQQKREAIGFRLIDPPK